MVTTNLLEDITQRAASLPIELQREALDFIEFIAQRANNGAAVDKEGSQAAPEVAERQRPFKSLLGALEHLNIHVTMEDIKEARRETWANFPREEPR